MSYTAGLASLRDPAANVAEYSLRKVCIVVFELISSGFHQHSSVVIILLLSIVLCLVLTDFVCYDLVTAFVVVVVSSTQGLKLLQKSISSWNH